MKVAANPVTGPAWSPPEAPPPPSPAPASEGGPSIADRMFGRGAPATPNAPWGKPEFAQSPAAGLAGLAAVNAGTAGLVQAELIQSQGQALLPAAPFAGLAAPQIMGQAMHAVQDRFAQHPQDGRPQGDQESFSDQQGQPQHEPPLSQAALWLALQEPSGVRPIPMPKPRPIEQDSFLSAGALQTQPPIWRGFSDGGQIPSSLPAQDGAPFISHPLSSLPLPPQPAQFTGWLKNAPAPDAAAATSATSASHASSPTQTNPAAPAATAPANAVEGTSAAAPKGPSADRNEIAALEMTLADPANKDMVAHFGGQLEPLPTWTTVGQGIEARYGADLGGRLYQLQKAQRAVEAEFFRAMDESRKDPPKDAAPSLQRPDQPAPTTDKPGWHYNPGGGHADAWTPPSWEYSPELFAQQYAKGESAAQKALASMYGPEPLKYVPGADTEVGSPGGIQLDGLRLREPRGYGGVEEGLTPDSLHVRDGWVQSGVTPPDHYLDPNRITKLNNNEFVWFDPVRGFMTDPDNLKESGLDKAFPYIMAAAFAAMGGWAASTAIATNVTTSAIAQGAAAGAVGSTLGQYVATGHVNFKSVLTSALAGGLTAGVMEIPGASEHLTGASTNVGKLLQATGRATIQGAIQEIIGGKFKDGFINSILASAAQEVGSLINAEIANTPGLTDSERSALRLLSRATTSAMRIVGSDDPAAGFAGDFLASVVGDILPKPTSEPQESKPDSPSPYGLASGDDGLGLRPGHAGQGVRWNGLTGTATADASGNAGPIYDFDPQGEWNPELPNPITDTDRPIAMGPVPFFVPPGLGNGVVVGGGYQANRPNGSGGSPGYGGLDPRYDLPVTTPGYPATNPGLGFRTPPFGITPPIVSGVLLGGRILAQNIWDFVVNSVGEKPVNSTGASGNQGVSLTPDLPLFRGGSGLDIRPGTDVVVGQDGLVHPYRPNGKPQGLSINLDRNDRFVQLHGGAFPVESIPEGLQLIQAGKPQHYVIAPSKPMTIQQYQNLLNEIQLGNFNKLP